MKTRINYVIENFFIRYIYTHSVDLDLYKMGACDCNNTENCHYLDVDLDFMCVRFLSKINYITVTTLIFFIVSHGSPVFLDS